MRSTRKGLVVVFGVLAMLVAGPGAEAHDLRCGGTAPLAVVCETGYHTPHDSIQHGPDYAGSANFIGDIESQIDYGSGARVFRCSVFLGQRRGDCVGDGFFPPPGTEFKHYCLTYHLGTNIPGGIGTWSCFVTHN